MVWFTKSQAENILHLLEAGSFNMVGRNAHIISEKSA